MFARIGGGHQWVIEKYTLLQKCSTSRGALHISAKRQMRLAASLVRWRTESRRGTDRHSGLAGNLFRICAVYLHRGHERVYRQGHSAEPSFMTFDLFRLLFDYYSLRSIENSFESLRRNGSKLFYISLYFVRHTRKPAEMHSIRVRPHNSDSEGRRFKSCRAYQRQNNTMRSSAAAGGVRSTDGVVFPFRLKPTSLGFESVFVMSSKLTDPATSEQTRTVGFPP